MKGYDLYGLYQSLRLHFSTESYNFFIYGGKTRVSVESFEKRKDKYLFHRLARKYNDEEMVSFLVANFVYNNNNFTRSLLEESADQSFRDWRKTTETEELIRLYATDLAKICTKETFNSLFEVKDGQHPKLLMLYLQKEVLLETLVILDNIFGFIRIWDKKIEDDIVYPKISLKIRKYSAFLNVNVNKYKDLTKKILLDV